MSVSFVDLQIGYIDFGLFVLANVLLAAAGYAINDYYDVGCDAVNKPDKNMLLGKIPRKHAYTLNFILNSVACIIGFYCAYKVGTLKLGFLFIIVALVLFYYSLKYKRQFLTGNIVVGILAAYCVASVWLFHFFALKANPEAFTDLIGSFGIITIFVGGYAVFAFIINFLREIVKDVEDLDGDKEYGFNTLPVRKGVKYAKSIVLALCILAMILLGVVQFFLFESYTMLSYYLFVIQILFIYLIIKTLKSNEKSDFHLLSIFSKIIMIAGLLSTQLLYIYF